MRSYLKNFRCKIGLSQQDVAEKIKISRQYYQQIENGFRQKDISLAMLQRLADVFSVPINQMIELENQYKAQLKSNIDEQNSKAC